jgi:hypothetical protein
MILAAFPGPRPSSSEQIAPYRQYGSAASHDFHYSRGARRATVLPKCKRCDDKVRFVPMVAAERIEEDIDFLAEFAA